MIPAARAARLVRLAALALFLASLQLTGCARVPAAPAGSLPQGAVLVLDPQVTAMPATGLPALVDRQAGVTLQTCGDLLRLLGTDTALGEILERPGFNAYAGCVAAAVVAQGRAAPAGEFDLRHVGDRLYRALDLASVRSSLAPRRPSEHYVLRDFRDAAVDIQPLSVTLQLGGFSHQFQVLALGDFQHTGRAELLVRFTDRATSGGSYDRVSLLVVGAALPSEAGMPPLVAVDALEVLRAGARRAR